MPDSKSRNFYLTFFLRFLFTGSVLCILLFNAVTLTKEIRILGVIRQKIPYLFMGNKFLGLESILKDIKYVGYYTDKSMDRDKDALQFAQAQYVLAPIILDKAADQILKQIDVERSCHRFLFGACLWGSQWGRKRHLDSEGL